MSQNNVSPNSSANMLRVIRFVLFIAVIGLAIYNRWQAAQRAAERTGSANASSTQNRLPPADTPTTAEQEAEVAAPQENDHNNPAIPKAKQPAPKAIENEHREVSEPKAKAPATRIIRTQVEKQSIRDQDGNVVFTGTIDLAETIARIQRSEELTGFHHDGITFENRERKLPKHGAGYYREWVHPTPKVRGPGPQRVITGENGEFWYTPNHYQTFIKLN